MRSDEIKFLQTPIKGFFAASQPLVDRLSRIIAALELDIPLTDDDADMVKRICKKTESPA